MNNFIKKLILTILVPAILYSCISFDKIKLCKNYNTHTLYFKCTNTCQVQYSTIYNEFQLHNVRLLSINSEKNKIPLLNIISTSEIIKKIEFSNIYQILEYQIIFNIKAELSLSMHQNIPINVTISRIYFDQNISPLEKYQEKMIFIDEMYNEAVKILIQKCMLLICKSFFKN